ncbi:hypothetical protein HYS49_03695 [Candidatus Woesearchaeota archaeon]|nr:hypothetical protein [Candidatus Woesearchaeota archaeon]
MHAYKQGLTATITAIKKHRALFSVLLVLQILFFFVLAFNGLRYQVKILSYAEEISTLVAEADLDPEQLQAGIPPLGDALPLYAAYNAMQETLLALLWTSLAIFLGFNSILWVGAQQLINPLPAIKKNLLLLGARGLKYILLTTLFLGLFLGSQFFLFKESILPNAALPKALFILPIAFYYFFLVSLAFIHLPGKELLKKVGNVGLKKAQHTLPAFLLLLSVIAGSSYGTFKLIETGKAPFVIILSGLLVLGLLLLTKIWWLATLQALAHGEARTEHSS